MLDQWELLVVWRRKVPMRCFPTRNPDRGKKGTDAVDSAQPEVAERTRIDLLEKDVECDNALIYT